MARQIQLRDPHQQRAFEFFNRMNHPHHNVTVPVALGDLPAVFRQQGLRFTEGILYWICRTANEVPRFRWRIRGEDIWEHDAVHPSVTVKTAASETFSFCTLEYDRSISAFVQNFRQERKRMQTEPKFADEEGRDDLLFLSSLPWFSFTGLQHAMPYHPTDSVPRITWGKTYSDHRDELRLPLNVQVHHAVVDGAHVGQFFQQLEKFVEMPERLFSSAEGIDT